MPALLDQDKTGERGEWLTAEPDHTEQVGAQPQSHCRVESVGLEWEAWGETMKDKR
ncbi:MAG: hypothetical protein NNA22_08160 [Nitrospira sp.]|nr:hypothetical protein [Nitrospira sp.]